MPAEVRSDIAGIQAYTATYDPASLATVTARDDAVTVPGVLSTDYCVAAIPPATINGGLHVLAARVTANNTVTVRLYNSTAGAVDMASGTWTFLIGR